MEIPVWAIYVPGLVLVLAGAGAYRWLTALQRRMNDHAERIARLEGRLERISGED